MGQLTKQEKAKTKKVCKDCVKKYRVTRKKYREHRNIFKKLLGYCPCCDAYFKYMVRTWRRNTQYVEESQNWLTACKECHEEDEAYFDDLWAQYYGSI